jgi:hypothetical protein
VTQALTPLAAAKQEHKPAQDETSVPAEEPEEVVPELPEQEEDPEDGVEDPADEPEDEGDEEEEEDEEEEDEEEEDEDGDSDSPASWKDEIVPDPALIAEHDNGKHTGLLKQIEKGKVRGYGYWRNVAAGKKQKK